MAGNDILKAPTGGKQDTSYTTDIKRMLLKEAELEKEFKQSSQHYA
jgi:hypothetical protein